ncbi:MAG: lysophospholipid acyltransferase family protein [Acidobacteriota bacterium]
MWLLPLVPAIANAVLRVFYRFDVSGERVPRTGPLLLISNHPNMVGDPASVAAASRRPVRFLAKSPLFAHPLAGAALRSLGAIPVFRRKDDPSKVHLNDAMFEEVQRALGEGSAIGIFPEGISHGGSSVAPLRTGAARIALGAAQLTSDAVAIVPVGLVYGRKKEFRSKATALIGKPVDWIDLRDRGEQDQDAVRELTARIDEALRSVTVNLEQWADAPAVRAAEAIYAAELRLANDFGAKLDRIQGAARALAAQRRSGDGEAETLVSELTEFSALLSELRLRPSDLDFRPKLRLVARWIVKRTLFLIVAIPVVMVGAVVFFVPYQLTRALDRALRLDDVERATAKILSGAALYLLWISGLAIFAGLRFNAEVATACLLGLPATGIFTLWLAQRGVESWIQARRFLVLTVRRRLREGLLRRRRELFERLEEVRERLDGAQQ